MPIHSVGRMWLKFDAQSEPYFEKTITKQGDKVKLSPKEVGYSKEIQNLTVIIKRDYYDPQGRPLRFYGLQKLLFKVPDKEEFKYYYLYFSKAAKMQNVCITFLSPQHKDIAGNYSMFTTSVSLNDKAIVSPIGEPLQLTPQQVSAMLENQEVLALTTLDENQQFETSV